MARPTVRREARTLVLIQILLVAAAAPAAAQWSPRATPARAPAVEITPYAGVLISDDLLEGPFGTAVGPAPAPIFGAQVAFPLAFGVSLIANAAYSSADLRASAPVFGGVDFGKSATWLYDGGVEVALPLASFARPLVQVGAGGVHRELNVEDMSTTADDFMFNVGVGLDLAFSRGAGLRLMARDYIGEFDFQEAAFFPIDGDRLHNFALSAGLRLSF
ncbi:MAG TPA: outer membrane beta-barrel protein [Longimicrobiales bacterium]